MLTRKEIAELEEKSIEELEAILVGLKRDELNLKQRKVDVKSVYDSKVAAIRAQEALERAGIEGVTVVPEPVVLRMRGQNEEPTEEASDD